MKPVLEGWWPPGLSLRGFESLERSITGLGHFGAFGGFWGLLEAFGSIEGLLRTFEGI